jgi:UDP-glucose 4-epimerase
MKQTVLITGHTGFIGRALVAALQGDEKFEVIGFSRSDGNLLDFDSLAGLPAIYKIVHLAGSVGVPQSWQRPLETYQNNILPTLNVLEFARRYRTPVIYMSSYIYGTPQYLPVDEAHPVNCNNPYARSKWQAEILCEAYAADFEVPVIILRPFNVYGPGQTRDSLIPHIVYQAKYEHKIQVKDLGPKRDYLYIDDLLSALLSVIDAEQNGSQIYNLGFGKSYSVQEIVEAALKLMKKQIPVISTEEHRPNEIMDCYSDSRKFAGRFSWRPQVNLDEGIAALLELTAINRTK